MKKFLIILTFALTLLFSNMVYAVVIPTEVELNQNLTITYNGNVQRFKNVKGDIVYPISYEGTTYLPIRSISCLFETKIEWDGNTNSIHLGKGTLDTIAAESISKFTPGTNQNIMVDLNQDIKIYHNNEVQTFKDVNGKVVYPLSYQGTTYLPVRAISNLYNAKIEWIAETCTVRITDTNEKVITSNEINKSYVITNGGSKVYFYVPDSLTEDNDLSDEEIRIFIPKKTQGYLNGIDVSIWTYESTIDDYLEKDMQNSKEISEKYYENVTLSEISNIKINDNNFYYRSIEYNTERGPFKCATHFCCEIENTNEIYMVEIEEYFAHEVTKEDIFMLLDIEY